MRQTSCEHLKVHPDYISTETDYHLQCLILNKEQLRCMYPECFSGIGKFKDYEYHITLEDNAKPVIHPPRNIPFALQPKFDREFDEMVEQGIITPVNGPQLGALVIHEKANGRLRTCLSTKVLNKVIKREHYPVPTVDDIMPKLCGSTLFSKLDAKQGYWNVKYLTTFNTYRGRYSFLRIPFGLRMSQDIFQKKIDETYEKFSGAVGIADDINVFGTEPTHDYNVHEAMERTRKAGIKLNFVKCTVKLKSCSFFGEIYTPQGVKPDPRKVEAIKNVSTFH